MIYKKTFLLSAILLLVGFFWLSLVKITFPVKIKLSFPRGISIEDSTRLNHPLLFYDKDTFYRSAEKARGEDKAFTAHISGGIIPHHLFPSYIIADFFSRLSKQKPKTIILIGPNHYEKGNYQALSSLYGWETPFGVVNPNEHIIQELVSSKLVKIDENVLPKDHAVAAIMPFIKFYLPDARVVPILLSGFMTIEETRILAERLKNYFNNDDIVILAAVDFSHGLPNQKAQKKDEITFELMKTFNFKKLLSLDSEYLDSPASIIVLLRIMQVLNTTNMQLLFDTNSGKMQKNDSIETTSYFSIAYY